MDIMRIQSQTVHPRCRTTGYILLLKFRAAWSDMTSVIMQLNQTFTTVKLNVNTPEMLHLVHDWVSFDLL